jgi:hypothetical protein
MGSSSGIRSERLAIAYGSDCFWNMVQDVSTIFDNE